jgi:hypothetical protein
MNETVSPTCPSELPACTGHGQSLHRREWPHAARADPDSASWAAGLEALQQMVAHRLADMSDSPPLRCTPRHHLCRVTSMKEDVTMQKVHSLWGRACSLVGCSIQTSACTQTWAGGRARGQKISFAPLSLGEGRSSA